jgi:hypothetical protein
VAEHQGGCRTGASAVMPEMAKVGRLNWFRQQDSEAWNLPSSVGLGMGWMQMRKPLPAC